MNLNLIVKTAVATALLSAASIPAFATSVAPPAAGPTPVPGFGAGGIVVEVWDTTTGHSLSEWLGGDTTSFGGPAATAGTTLDYGVLGTSSFASTFSSTEIAAGNVQFVVEGANAQSANPTVDFTVSSLGKITGSAVSSLSSKLNTGIASTLNGSTACNNVNPCIALNGSTDPNYAVNNLGTTAVGSAKTSGVAGGAALDFYQVVSDGKSLGTQTAVQFASSAGAATWTLSASGDLVYSVPTSPVPLPAAVWLLGSGLLGLAGVGRRKVRAA